MEPPPWSQVIERLRRLGHDFAPPKHCHVVLLDPERESDLRFHCCSLFGCSANCSVVVPEIRWQPGSKHPQTLTGMIDEKWRERRGSNPLR